jgi:hypothetical protein
MLNLLRLYIPISFNFSLERLKQKNNSIDRLRVCMHLSSWGFWPQSSDLARINGFLARGRRFNFATGTNRQQMPAGDHCLCALCNEQLNINAAQIQATDSFSMLQTVSASTIPPYTSTYRSWKLNIVEKAETNKGVRSFNYICRMRELNNAEL